MKDKKPRRRDTLKRREVVPAEVEIQKPDRETHKNHQHYDLLQRLELCEIKSVSVPADPVGGHHQDVFKQRNAPN